jgi:hypothetical protein
MKMDGWRKEAFCFFGLLFVLVSECEPKSIPRVVEEMESIAY